MVNALESRAANSKQPPTVLSKIVSAATLLDPMTAAPLRVVQGTAKRESDRARVASLAPEVWPAFSTPLCFGLREEKNPSKSSTSGQPVWLILLCLSHCMAFPPPSHRSAFSYFASSSLPSLFAALRPNHPSTPFLVDRFSYICSAA